MTRESGPAKAASPQTPGERSDTRKDTPRGKRRHGWCDGTDPLTADHWAALCRAADRGELAEVDA